MRVRKRFGQHFLVDENVIGQIFDSLKLRHTDSVLEIGPGPGTLTRRLLLESDDVHAIEIDRDLAAELGEIHPSLRLIVGDVLKVDLAQLLDRIDAERLRVVGNLPYNISTPLLGRLFDVIERVHDVSVMLQKEVVDRLVAVPETSAFGRLSVMAQHYAHVDRLLSVPARAFAPRPKVESAFVRLAAKRRASVSTETLADVLRAAFSARRKRVGNALKAFQPDWDALGIDPGRRPDAITVDEFVAIAAAVDNGPGRRQE